uniref:Metallo-beta-lactamase domain-containing protein n=1 Tax=Oryza punctata TaxID=4537 RepID=A0A0E0K798_ORYPU
MALSLRFAAAPPRRPRAIASFRACSASSPALNSGRRPQNVPGDFFVDHRCIDCQTCRWMAPALLSCPTASIHTEKPAKDIFQVQNMFPLPIDTHLLPGSVCLFYKPVKALFTGDHVAKSEESDDYLFLMYNRQPVSLQLDSLRKLLKLDFEWFLPGHGYRIHYKDVRAKDSAIESEILVYGNRNLTKRTRTLTLLFRTMALMSLRFAPAAAPPSASVAAPPRRRARPVASSSSASSPALESRRRPQNVPGDFFVDHRCIDCQTCRWMAPEVFKRVDGKAAVAAQPISDDHRTKALQGSVCLFYKPIKALFTGDHVAKSEESDDLDLFLIGLATGQHEKIVEVRLRVDMAIESIIKTYMLRIQQSKTFVAIEH